MEMLSKTDGIWSLEPLEGVVKFLVEGIVHQRTNGNPLCVYEMQRIFPTPPSPITGQKNDCIACGESFNQSVVLFFSIHV